MLVDEEDGDDVEDDDAEENEEMLTGLQLGAPAAPPTLDGQECGAGTANRIFTFTTTLKGT